MTTQLTALDLLIILQRFRELVVSVPAYQQHANVLKPVLDDYDAACLHLKSKYQEVATELNHGSDKPVLRDTIYIQGYDFEGKALSVGHRGSMYPDRDIVIMDAAIEMYYAAVVRKQDNITPMVLWRHVMGSDWVPPEDAADGYKQIGRVAMDIANGCKTGQLMEDVACGSALYIKDTA